MQNEHTRVLVTGADGFIGSHLTQLLLDEGYSVRALSLYNSFGINGWLEDLPRDGRLEIVSGDVRDPAFCRMISSDVDTVFHLAALIAIPYSYVAPDSYVDTTSEVYGTAIEVPITEHHPRQPQSPYSATKIGADALALSFYNAFSTPVVIARPFNTYGPRQSARAIIPTIITQIANGATEIKTGDLTPTRDFNFVTDTARGFLALARAEGVEGKEYNIATGTEVTMLHTLQTIARLMGRDVTYVTDPQRLRPGKSEVFRLCGDSTRLRELTGWSPLVSLEEGLQRTIDWFVRPENLAKYKWDIYNV